jgi:hypothetical protein
MNLGGDGLLRNVVQGDGRVGAEQEVSLRSREQAVQTGNSGSLDHLGDVIGSVAEDNLPRFVEDGELVSAKEDGTGVEGLLDLTIGYSSSLWNREELEDTSVVVVPQDSGLVIWIARQGQRRIIVAAEAHAVGLGVGGEVVANKVALLDEVQGGALDGPGWTLSLQLEYLETGVVASSEEVCLRVGSEDPEPIGLTAEGLNGAAHVGIPDADGAILRSRDDEVLEVGDAADVVGVTTELFDFICTGIIHLPDTDGAIVGTRHDQGLGWVEGSPVDSLLVTLKDELDTDLGGAEKVLG